MLLVVASMVVMHRVDVGRPTHQIMRRRVWMMRIACSIVVKMRWVHWAMRAWMAALSRVRMVAFRTASRDALLRCRILVWRSVARMRRRHVVVGVAAWRVLAIGSVVGGWVRWIGVTSWRLVWVQSCPGVLLSIRVQSMQRGRMDLIFEHFWGRVKIA